jgi:hypothetical protein
VATFSNNPFDFSIVQKNIVDNLTKVGYIEYNDDRNYNINENN